MIRFLQTPGRGKKIVLGSLLMFICLALVISLGVGGMTPDSATQPGIVATVGDEKITSDEVRRLAQQIAQRQGYPPQFASLLTDRALQSIISQRTLVWEARRIGLKVSEDELKDELRNGFLGRELFPKGTFVGEEKYRQFVTANFQLSPAQFEKMLMDDLLASKLRALISDSATVSRAEVDREAQRQGTKIKFDYAVLSVDDIAKRINPPDGELKAYYESHKDSYANSIPEKRKIRYAVADLNKVQAETQVTPAEIARYYDEHQEQYRQPEQVKASHILVKTPQPSPDGKVDEKAIAEARQRAESLLQQLKAGAKFEQLAKKQSDDKGSAIQGGSLGWFQRGAMVPEFEQVAFSFPKGQLSDPVKSSFGFHIIRVDDKKPAGIVPLAEVKDSIEQVLRQEKAQNRIDALERTLTSEIRGQSLEAIAQKHGLQVFHSDFVSRTDSLPGVGTAAEFMDAAFSANEKAPPAIARTAQALVLFEVPQVKAAQTPTFEDIRQRVAQEFRQERARTLLIAKTQEFADRAHAEHNLKRAAQELGASFKTSELVGVNSQVPGLGAMSGSASEAFSLKQGEISGPIYTGRDGAVLGIVERKEPSPAELQQSADRVREELLQRKQNDMLGVYFGGLKQQLEKAGKLKINDKERKALSRNNSEGI